MKEFKMKNETLVFSIALNGYQWRYRQHLRSHEKFAKKFNYHYQVVTQPFFSKLGIECCWLKLTLMHNALLAGYKYVIFLDADAIIQTTCPDISALIETGKDLYMVKGYSNRFNSGVMIVRNSRKVRFWLLKVINHRHNQVKPENDVGWGENSHIIELSKNCDFIKELPHTWNNTYDLNLNDYIRHHNYGPLRQGILDNLVHKTIFCIANRLVKVTLFLNKAQHKPQDKDLLYTETKMILLIYPCFSICTDKPPQKSSSAMTCLE